MKDFLRLLFELAKNIIYIPFLMFIFAMVMVVYSFDCLKRKVINDE